MAKEKKEEIELKPAEGSPWGKFLAITMALDNKYNLPNGWHWFLGFYYLHNELGKISSFSLQAIQVNLDETHWLTRTDDDQLKEFNETLVRTDMSALLQDLLNWLNNPEIINIIDFSNLFFDTPIDFNNFVFPLAVSFQNTEFRKDATFGMATFHGIANFNDVKFHNKAHFHKADFFVVAEFGRVIFSEDAYFSNATFIGVNFLGATFSSIADFAGANFSNIVNFRRATFSGLVRFKGAVITGGTNFADADFRTRVPQFYDAKLNADINWDNAKWPSLNKTDSPDLTKQIQDAYGNLAYHMKTLDKYHDQHFFYRQEMRCRRRLEGVFNFLLYGAYEKFSNYGYGVGHALFWWFLNMLGGFIALLIISYQGDPTMANPFKCSFFTSIANAHSFLFFHDGPLMNCYDSFKEISNFSFIWATQTILGIPILFILLLTLRVRFRLK